MGCVLSKPFLRQRVSPEQAAPVEQQQGGEKIQEGGAQLISSHSNDSNKQADEHKQKLSSKPLNAWQARDHVQESIGINDHHSPTLSRSASQPTGLECQNQAEQILEQVPPNQALDEPNEKKLPCFNEQTTSSLSNTERKIELEKQAQHTCEQSLPSQPNVWLSPEVKMGILQRLICEQGEQTKKELEEIHEERTPSGSGTHTLLVYEDPLGHSKECFSSSKSNICQRCDHVLENENNCTQMPQPYLLRGKNGEIADGSQLGQKHEQQPSSQLDTNQENGLDHKKRFGTILGNGCSSQMDISVCQSRKLKEENHAGGGDEQEPVSQSNVLKGSDTRNCLEQCKKIPCSPKQSACTEDISELENKTESGDILNSHIRSSETNTGQQSDLEQEETSLGSSICQLSILQKKQQKPEQIDVQTSLENLRLCEEIGQQKSTSKSSISRAAILNKKASPSSSEAAQKTSGEINLPEDWVPMPSPESPFHTVPLLRDSDEFKAVMKHFQPANENLTVKKVQRIQNPELYFCYMLRKKEMEEANGGSNEMRLFHAADCNSMHAIMEQGFSRKTCSVQKKAYGRGLYFCKDAFYCLAYTGNVSGNDRRYLYLARVLVGQYCQGSSLMILPPPKQPSIPETLYESVVDNTVDPSIFVVFYRAQCYPEYLITF